VRKPTIAMLSALVSVSFTHALSAEGGKAQSTDVTFTPTQPHLLPDLSTRILVGTKTLWENRKRFAIPKVVREDLTLDMAPNTVIASGGYLFHLTMPHEYKFGHVRKEDMIFTVLESCTLAVRSEKGEAPRLNLGKLKGSVSFACDNRQSSQIQSIHGVGKHFVALRIGRTEIYTRHPSKVLGTGMDMLGRHQLRLEEDTPRVHAAAGRHDWAGDGYGQVFRLRVQDEVRAGRGQLRAQGCGSRGPHRRVRQREATAIGSRAVPATWLTARGLTFCPPNALLPPDAGLKASPCSRRDWEPTDA